MSGVYLEEWLGQFSLSLSFFLRDNDDDDVPGKDVGGVAGTILAGLVVRPNKGAQHWFQR